MGSWICQNPTASTAEPGELPLRISAQGLLGVVKNLTCSAFESGLSFLSCGVPSIFEMKFRRLHSEVP